MPPRLVSGGEFRMSVITCTLDRLRDGKEKGKREDSHGVTNAALTGIKIEESDLQLIPKSGEKILAR